MSATPKTSMPKKSCRGSGGGIAAQCGLPPPSRGCPHDRRFYAYLDRTEPYAPLWGLCSGQSYFCNCEFIARMLAHPCRTKTLTADTPVAVLNAIQRGWDNNLEFGYRYSLRVLRRLPRKIAEHRAVYLFAGGEFWTYRAYTNVQPRYATYFTQEPLFAKAEPLGRYLEPLVPGRHDACYLYAPNQRVVNIPYGGPGSDVDEGFNIVGPHGSRRRYQVAYYAGMHGRALYLRRRLYEICRRRRAAKEADAQQRPWSCWSTPLEGGTAGFLQRLRESDFCFAPVGDGPLRITIWQALRRGCIPVLFSSCGRGGLAEAYHTD